MIELSCVQAERACRVLLDSESAEGLIDYWRLAFPDQFAGAPAALVIASVIASGNQEPSATTALSVAQGIIDKPAGQALLLAGLAYDALASSEIMTDAIGQLVGEGLYRIFEKIPTTLPQKETRSE